MVRGCLLAVNKIKTNAANFDLGATLAIMLEGITGVQITSKMNSTNFTSKSKVFAFTKGKGEVVIKLPPDKVLKLLVSKKASSLVMGKRTMKEWVVFSCNSRRDCQRLLTHFEEAKTYVSASKKRFGSRK
jgi:hypothetical protein